MRRKRSVTGPDLETLPGRGAATNGATDATSAPLAGVLLGAIGVLVFSFTFPATKLALRSFDPWCVAFGRAAVAALAAGAVLRAQRPPRPTPPELGRLLLVAGGVVVGFPLLSSLALRTSSAAHGAVVIALLPAATAAVGTLRTRQSPGPLFWLAAGAGTAVVTGYAVAHASGGLALSDGLLLLAVLICAIGYAEGGQLARRLGGPHTICWALVLAAPVTVPVGLLTAPGALPGAAAAAGFLYVSAGSMFLGFFAWYAGLARGGVTRISQVQLGQTPLTLAWSALVLGEPIGWGTGAVAVAVLLSVAVTQRARIPGAAGGRRLGRRARGAPGATAQAPGPGSGPAPDGSGVGLGASESIRAVSS